jgi:MFS family permease
LKFDVRLLPLVGLISAEFLSMLGNQVAAVAIPILVLQYTNSAMTAGIAGIGNVLPIVLAAFVGGRAIDRFGAWRLSLFADVLSFISVLVLPLTFLISGDASPALIFVLVFIGAMFDPTGIAARQTLVPRLTRLARQPLARINTARGSLENGADLAGPLLGVGLIAAIGAINTFFVNAASFLLCAVVFAATVPRGRKHIPIAGDADFMLGARFVWQDSQLKALTVMGSICNFVLLPFLGLLLPVLALRVFHNTALLGICVSAFGVGATLGALTFVRLGRTWSRTTIFYGGLVLSGAAIASCGIASTQTSVAIAAALGGLLLGAGNPLEQTILQEVTPRAIAGQVFTSLGAIRFAAGPLGLLLAGIATERAGVQAVLVTAGASLVAAALFGWWLRPLGKGCVRPAEVR